eukprot:4340929-Amphidinium_carterae.1
MTRKRSGMDGTCMARTGWKQTASGHSGILLEGTVLVSMMESIRGLRVGATILLGPQSLLNVTDAHVWSIRQNHCGSKEHGICKPWNCPPPTKYPTTIRNK